MIRSFLFPLLVLAAWWLLLIRQLGAQWSIYQQYNYGWSVPFLCAYLIWQRVQSSKLEPLSSIAKPSPFSFLPSPFFRAAFVFCALLYAPTRFFHEANPVWRLTILLWTLEVIGLTLLTVRLVFGARRFAQVAFPICFFLVAVPWLYPLESLVVDSLTRLNVGATIELLGIFGVPAVQHANVIEIGTGMVGIDEACSGIRSFQATLMISLFLGELYLLSPLRRVLCMFAGFAFAFVFNLGRTLLLTRIAAVKGTGAVASWHDPAGVTILVACFISLWLLAGWLRKRQAHLLNRAAPVPTQPAPVETLPVPASPFSLLRSPILSLAVWLIVVEVGTQFWYRSHEGAPAVKEHWSVQLPEGYQPKAVQKLVTTEFKYDQQTAAEWHDSNGAHWQLFYFRWNPARSLDRRVRVQRAKMHGPETCLTHIGMKLNGDLGVKQISVGDFNLAIQQYVFEVEGTPLHVFYGIYEDQTGSGVLANRRIGTANRVAAALAGSRNYGQRFLEIAVTGYDRPEQALAALTRELAPLIQVQK